MQEALVVTPKHCPLVIDENDRSRLRSASDAVISAAGPNPSLIRRSSSDGPMSPIVNVARGACKMQYDLAETFESDEKRQR